ncbi:hypothetical protein DERP_012197 [Dermatophagoides pteronyssinus]|uniref:Secreted protein n=1 Tax=Dermatophagoides pteronyssinus TaxID=6956 RepID=A0ABQ8JGF3_DERPT|nr:hypothetical protein DERP_012197 [Dermatophagoides pteronyssinus]
MIIVSFIIIRMITIITAIVLANNLFISSNSFASRSFERLRFSVCNNITSNAVLNFSSCFTEPNNSERDDIFIIDAFITSSFSAISR